jgi:hypothetical protein
MKTGERHTLHAHCVVNSAGLWAQVACIPSDVLQQYLFCVRRPGAAVVVVKHQLRAAHAMHFAAYCRALRGVFSPAHPADPPGTRLLPQAARCSCLWWCSRRAALFLFWCCHQSLSQSVLDPGLRTSCRQGALPPPNLPDAGGGGAGDAPDADAGRGRQVWPRLGVGGVGPRPGARLLRGPRARREILRRCLSF